MANEYMMVSSVTNVLSQATDWLIDLGENWIDAQLDDGLLKEIPIIKALMLGKNVIRTVTECHEIRQISQFLLTIDTECTDEARRKRYVKVLNESFNRFLIISLDVLICRYSPLLRAFPALFISEEPHKSFYYPSCFRSQK